MGETANIAEVASKVSKDVFKWLKWSARPLMDINWECRLDEKHKKKRFKTHPTDVVFHYRDPYTEREIYINTDLKSYASNSITKSSVVKALNSLSQSIECANISQEWSDKFILDANAKHDVMGMLFVYNHDNSYCEDFDELLSKINPKSLKIAKGNKVLVLGPEKINYLYNVITDIKLMKSEDIISSNDDYTFYYPDLVLYKRHGCEWGQPASIESITSPWLIVKHRNESGEEYTIYYNRHGSTPEEFIYLLDSLSYYQLLLSDTKISIKFINSCDSARANLDKAVYLYLSNWGFDGFRKKHLENLHAEHITNYVKSFNLDEVGMRDAK